MNASWFKGKTVTVFGIGLLGGGVGTIKYLAEQGANVIATDIKTREHLEKSLKKLEGLKNVTYILGQHRREDFERVDMVIKTPGCPWTNEHVQIALKNNIPVETDASLFLQLCPAPIIGVTGTKGKTTTTKFIYHILKNGDRTPVLFGVEKLSVLDRLSYVDKKSIVVFELSSWRLSALRYTKMSPHIAVFTNFFPDHLNYYKSMDEYFADKAEIFKHQRAKDYFIYNASEERLVTAAKTVASLPFYVDHKRRTDAQGVFRDGGGIFYNDGIDVQRVLEENSLTVVGDHNYTNIMLAMSAALATGMKMDKIIEALHDLPKIEHRLEFVAQHQNVDYYNDTAASNPQAAALSIAAFSERPIILLAGGSDKGLPLGEFPMQIAKYAKRTIFFKGVASDKMIAEVRKIRQGEDRDFDYDVVESMSDAVEIARRAADEGDVVLLSPGAASFGVFKNEFDRGDQFRAIVKEIK